MYQYVVDFMLKFEGIFLKCTLVCHLVTLDSYDKLITKNTMEQTTK